MGWTRFGVMVAFAVSACDSGVEPGVRDGGFARNGAVALRYVVDFPDGEGPFPVVVYGPGSGEVSKSNSMTQGHAGEWLSLGYAVVRYDKRGVGESGGDLLSLSTANSHEVVPTLAADMRAVLNEALSLPRIDAERVGLFGVSQANWYMPLVAEADPRVDWVVVLTGGLIPVGPKNEWERLVFVEGRDPFAESTLDEWALYDGPLGWDQRPAVRDAERPYLYLLGGRDRGVPMAPNLEEAEALRADGADVTVLTYPVGEHLMPLVPYWFEIEDWLGEIGAL